MANGLLDVSDFTPDVQHARNIDPDQRNLMPQVTVDEDHQDELIITEHPVEQGAVVHDHAYKRPAELRLQIGWTTAPSAQIAGGLPAANSMDVQSVYEQLLSLQAERRPFTVYTGKRTYQNMLIASLRTHTDSKLAHTLLADVSLREVVLVNTQVAAGGGITSSATTDVSQLFDAQSNQSSWTIGEVQTLPATLTDEQITAAGGDISGGF